jgi:hypothetical protein
LYLLGMLVVMLVFLNAKLFIILDKKSTIITNLFLYFVKNLI